MERTYTVFHKEKTLKINNEQLSKFASHVRLNKSYRDRVSELLILNLFVYSIEFGINPREVIEEIENLESGDGNTQTKPAEEFTRPPLAGLWHKHFFTARFLPKNILNSLQGGVLDNLVNEIMDPSKSSIITEEMISELAHRVINEPVRQRSNSNKLTGEWIIFAKKGSKNYYLCLSTHDAGDDFIAEQIRDHCVRDFPFLSDYV